MSMDADSNLSGKSNLIEPGIKKVKKKKVVWADTFSKPLEDYCYFVLDENERGIFKLVKIFEFAFTLMRE